jgi:hypothetical protein
MKSIVLNEEDASLLRTGRLEKVCFPLEEKRDGQGRTFSEACAHYKKHGPSKEMCQLIANLDLEKLRNQPITTTILATQYISPYELGEDVLPYSADSKSPIGRPLRVTDRKINQEKKILEIYLRVV